jgi:hypothetical protein
MHLMTPPKGWSRAGVATVLLGLLTGCGEGAKLISDTGHGGVVTYPYRGENGHLLSPLRTDALKLVEQRCALGYTIVREGETKGRTRMVENAAGTEAISEKRWAIQFLCRLKSE